MPILRLQKFRVTACDDTGIIAAFYAVAQSGDEAVAMIQDWYMQLGHPKQEIDAWSWTYAEAEVCL